MTTEPSPEQVAPPADAGWAFTPRRPTTTGPSGQGPGPGREAGFDAGRRARDDASGFDTGRGRDDANGFGAGRARDDANGFDAGRVQDDATGSGAGRARDDANGFDARRVQDDANGFGAGRAREDGAGFDTGRGRDDATAFGARRVQDDGGRPSPRQPAGHSAGQADGRPPARDADVAAAVPPSRVVEPAAGAAGRKPARRRGRVLLVLALLAAAGGATAVAAHRGSEGPSASKHLAAVWQVPAPAADDELIGSWVTRKLLIRASTRSGVTAYNLADGSAVWTAALPANAAGTGTRPCAMSPTLTADGLGTVAFGKDGNSCTALAGIDTVTGTVLWTVPLVDAAHRTAMSAKTYLQGGVATIVGENFLGGLDARTGRRVWGFQPRGIYCNAYTWGGAGIVLVDDYCADSKSPFTLTAYDGRTGRKLWSQKQDAHTDVAHVFSGSPLIASVHKAGEDSVRIYAPSGSSRKLAVGNTELAPGNDSDADHSARLVGGVLVAPAQSAAGSEVDGFDTATGARLWSYPATALATAVAGDDRVYALAGPPAEPQLVRLDPRTGQATAVAALPAVTGHKPFTAGTVYVTPDGGVLELDAQGTTGGIRFSR